MKRQAWMDVVLGAWVAAVLVAYLAQFRHLVPLLLPMLGGGS